MKINFKNFNYKTINKNKIVILVLILTIFCLLFLKGNVYISADDNNDNFDEELALNVDNILENIDFSQLQDILEEINNDTIFENTSILDKIKALLNGRYFTDYVKLGEGILNLIFHNVKNIIPFIFTIISIALITSIILNFRNDFGNSEVVNFICLSLIITFILVSFKDVLYITNKTILNLKNIMEIIFPILITLLTSIGSYSTISIFNPLIVILTSTVTFLFKNLLLPIFILIFLLNILNNISNSVKLNKFIEFFNSLFKWSIGIIFSVFLGLFSIQGISAGKYDSISIKTTKFAIKSYVPLIGSFISESMDFIVLGSILVKNSIGFVGIIILFYCILSPVINILILKFGLQLAGGIIELTGNDKISNFIHLCSKLLIMPIILILGVALMFVMVLCLIMSTANIM